MKQKQEIARNSKKNKKKERKRKKKEKASLCGITQQMNGTQLHTANVNVVGF